ncbi:MAG: protein kinase, partial [Myxococcota bacterium]
MGNRKPLLERSVVDGDSFAEEQLDTLDEQLMEAFAQPEVSKPKVGQTIDGRFVLEGELGQGGMGWVYSARHLATGGQVALKVMHPKLGDEGKARFAMEARHAASLTHPNTVRVLDYGQEGEHPYLVMEFLRGEPLDKALKAQGRFPLARAVSIASQVLKSLWEAHD